MTYLMNLGCGPVVADGWVNIDVSPPPPPLRFNNFAKADMRNLDSVFPPESFDGVLMNHSLQQVRDTEVVDVLRNVWRVLRPGGAVRIIVPDVVAAFEAFEDFDAEVDDEWAGFAAIEDFPRDAPDCKLTRYLTWNGTNLTCFTRGALAYYIGLAGFTAYGGRVTHVAGLDALDSRLEESIVVEAIK